jgi:hypothetical protein
MYPRSFLALAICPNYIDYIDVLQEFTRTFAAAPGHSLTVCEHPPEAYLFC